VFLTVNAESEGEHTDGIEETRTRESSRSSESSGTDELELIRNERDELQAAVHALTLEKANLQEQLQVMQQALESSKRRVK